MKGHIYQRSKGSWTIVYDLPSDSVVGKRRQKSQTVKGTKKYAERALREILTSIEQGAYVKPNKMTVGEWLNQWCETYAVMNTTKRTYVSYRSVLDNHLIPGLGRIYLCSLEPQQIQDYYALQLSKGRSDGNGGLSSRSVLYHHRILAKALDHAVRMGMLVRNVGKVVSPPRVARKTMNILDPEQAMKFLDVASETVYYPLFSTLLYTGMRRGEALALRWKNVDLLGLEINVVETVFKIKQQYIVKEPKTSHGKRAISLSPSLAGLLREYQGEQQRLRKEMGSSLSEDDLVFSWPDGRPFDPDSVTHTFGKVMKKAGLKGVRLHDLRHTHASLMLKAGIHAKVVSERLGHANIGITLDTYSHLLPGLQEDAAERFDRIIENDNSGRKSGASVSKMLAENGGLASNLGEPHRNRTCNLLIKSQLLCQLS
jgi:integrase